MSLTATSRSAMARCHGRLHERTKRLSVKFAFNPETADVAAADYTTTGERLSRNRRT